MKNTESSSSGLNYRDGPPRAEAMRDERDSPALLTAHGPAGIREQFEQFAGAARSESAEQQANNLLWSMQKYAAGMSWG